jgi:hypothetical protein
MAKKASQVVRTLPTHLDTSVSQPTTMAVNLGALTSGYYALSFTGGSGKSEVVYMGYPYRSRSTVFQKRPISVPSAEPDPNHPTGADRKHFDSLVGEWHRQRGASSVISDMAMKPAYQNIIGMGPKALPLILERLETEANDPDHWDWALMAITQLNQSPVLETDFGDTRKIAQAWLEWARQRNA